MKNGRKDIFRFALSSASLSINFIKFGEPVNSWHDSNFCTVLQTIVNQQIFADHALLTTDLILRWWKMRTETDVSKSDIQLFSQQRVTSHLRGASLQLRDVRTLRRLQSLRRKLLRPLKERLPFTKATKI